ncbi:alpha/beta hydrolase [Skermania sp. ID1734]|uniref:alpha/beta hydrolase n=1 Tax=Skermania sp. ID1734 TaxID=2597516 RepID=UPI00163D6BD0|nr:alpha/beta hydrolase [Skermania sp. ID1734]
MPTFKTADGVELFYKDWGVGRPVLFVHGWTLGADMWEYQLTALADRGLRCVAYDIRGAGRSDQPADGNDPDTLADDLAALMEYLDLREAMLVGHSMGAAQVLRYLARHGSERVSRVVFVSIVAPMLHRNADNPGGVDPASTRQTPAALATDRGRFATALADPWFGNGLPGVTVSRELVRWAVGLFLQSSAKATIDMYREFAYHDFRPDLGAVDVPTMVIHGDSDAMVPLEQSSAKVAAAVPTAELTMYETPRTDCSSHTRTGSTPTCSPSPNSDLASASIRVHSTRPRKS